MKFTAPFICLASTLPLSAADTVKVIKIINGDMVDVLTSKRETILIRLNGIDVPETGQPFGKNAKQCLAKAVGNRCVSMTITDKDRYRRSIADIRYGAARLMSRWSRKASLGFAPSMRRSGTI